MANVPRAPYVSASFTTQVDLSAKQYYAGALSAGLIVAASLTKGQVCAGIVMEKVHAETTDEKTVQMAISGICRYKAGDTISEGNMLVTDTDGTLIPDDAANQFVVGQALEDAVDGDIASMRLVLAPTTTS
jgi:hypothetical protein